MNIRNKLSALESHALGILLVLHDIDQENDDEFPALEAVSDRLRAALYAGGTLPADELEKVGPLIAKARELTGFDSDDDDGRSLGDWFEELQALAPKIERQFVTATGGIDTSHIAF